MERKSHKAAPHQSRDRQVDTGCDGRGPGNDAIVGNSPPGQTPLPPPSPDRDGGKG